MLQKLLSNGLIHKPRNTENLQDFWLIRKIQTKQIYERNQFLTKHKFPCEMLVLQSVNTTNKFTLVKNKRKSLVKTQTTIFI